MLSNTVKRIDSILNTKADMLLFCHLSLKVPGGALVLFVSYNLIEFQYTS